MKKKLLIGAVVPLVASLGLWAGLANASAAHAPTHRPTSGEVTTGVDTDNLQVGDQTTPDKAALHASNASEDPAGSDTDNVQSGDQTAPDNAGETSEDPSSEGEATTPENDGVDCQQDGNSDGVNAAGSGPGCDGSGA